MRGLPACGKTEKALALVEGTEGIICDPHKWFEEQGEEFRHYKLTKAIRWAWFRCLMAAKQGITPIVMDMHVGVSQLAKKRLRELEAIGYRIELVEPDSDDWKRIKAMLYNKTLNRQALDREAELLAERSQYHKYTEIRARMNNWINDPLHNWRHPYSAGP